MYAHNHTKYTITHWYIHDTTYYTQTHSPTHIHTHRIIIMHKTYVDTMQSHGNAQTMKCTHITIHTIYTCNNLNTQLYIYTYVQYNICMAISHACATQPHNAHIYMHEQLTYTHTDIVHSLTCESTQSHAWLYTALVHLHVHAWTCMHIFSTHSTWHTCMPKHTSI